MSVVATGVSERASELRREFDHAFAEPARAAVAGKEDLIGLRIAGQAYAIRLGEIAGLHAEKKVTRVPGGAAALRGIAGFRGALLPVYDLAMLLGYARAEAPRWLVVAAGAPVALAFERFEGQLRVSRNEILVQAAGPDAAGAGGEIVRRKDFLGSVLHVPSVIEAIKAVKA